MPILLFSANDYHSLYVARSLAKGKYTIYFLGPAGQAIRFSRFCTRYYTYKRTEDGLIRQIQMICKRHTICVVVPLDLSATLCLSQISHCIDVPVMPLSNTDLILRLSDKWESTFLFDEAGIRRPKTIRIEVSEDLRLDLLPIPFLVKPLQQGGARGIYKITTDQDIINILRSHSPYVTFPMIAQQFIDGQDVDMSIISRDGNILGYTIQQWKSSGYLELIDDPNVLSVGKKIVSTLRYSGLMHIDMRRDYKTGEIYVLECNPRSWGSIGASIGAGVDFIDLAIISAKNKQVSYATSNKTTYMTPLALLRQSIRNPVSIRQASAASKRDFKGMFTDPLPYIILAVSMCLERALLSMGWVPFLKPYLLKWARQSYIYPICTPTA